MLQYQRDATRQKQRREREKTVADSQLEELFSQRPDDADTASAALQDMLAEIADKDAQSVALQRQVQCTMVHYVPLYIWCQLSAQLLSCLGGIVLQTPVGMVLHIYGFQIFEQPLLRVLYQTTQVAGML